MIRRPPRSTPLSLHDALPISTPLIKPVPASAVSPPAQVADASSARPRTPVTAPWSQARPSSPDVLTEDRKSTRLNSSHLVISYAVFCLKKKNTTLYSITYHQL